MTRPLWVLAFFSVFIGLVGAPFLGAPIKHFLPFEGIEEVPFDVGLAAFSALVAGAGILCAAAVYYWKTVPASTLRRAAGPLHTLVERKYYFDEVYGLVFVRGTLWIAGALRIFDIYVVDALVNLVGLAGLSLARLYRLVDIYIVDGLVNLLGWVVARLGAGLRYVQTGRAENYLLIIALGVIILLAAGLFR